MAEYTWKPTGLFEARQINSAEDLDAWIASLGPRELSGEWAQFSELTNEGVADGMFTFTFHLANPDWSGKVTVHEPLGWWMVANKEDANLSQESDESFQSRFIPAG